MDNAGRIIAEHMGGEKRLKVMLGAKNFMFGNNYLYFQYPHNNKTHYCKVVLQPNDTYKLELGYQRSKSVITRTFTQSGLYCDMLKQVFERETGLHLSLGTLGRIP